MKRNDIVMILAVACVAGVVSFIASQLLFATPKNRHQQVEVAPAISATFKPPETAYFNSESVDPTQTIQIGNTTNPTPFNGSN